MKAFARLVSVLAVPIRIMNIFGGIVSGIWLAILGDWKLIGYGILALIVSNIGLSLVMALGLIFVGPAANMIEKGNKIGVFFLGLLSTIYNVGVLTAWCILVLIFYTNHTDAASIIPVLIWSYGIATNPIVWLAKKDLESGNEHAMITTFFIAVAYILTILAILLVEVSLLNILVLFGVVMSIGIIVQFYYAYLADKSREYY